MANIYNFRINSVECYTNLDGLENVIYQVHFTYTAQNEEQTHRASINNVISLDAPETDSFVSFNDLRDSDVISWIEPLVNTEKLQENLDAMLQEKMQPTRVSLTLKTDEDQTSNQTVVGTSEAEQVESSESLATEETTEETV